MARPALAALAEQQKVIDEQDKHIAGLVRVAKAQQEQIDRLGRGLQYLSQAAGMDAKVASAMTRQADVQNPAQPVPEPPAQPATQSTQEAEAPEAMADVNSPGLVPGSTNDVAADATTTAYQPGLDVPGPAFKNLVDVTAPVDGTQTPRPLSEVKTLTDVRVGDPMNPETAFPLRGPFQNAQRTSSKQEVEVDRSNRTMASLRLARLRIQAGMAEGGDIELATEIDKTAELSTEAIETEIKTLENVSKAAAKQQRNPRLVPRTASQRPAPPSMQSVASAATPYDEVSDSDLFD